MLLRKNENLIDIAFKYNPKLIELVRTLNGRKWDGDRKVWTIPLSGSDKNLLRLAEAGFTVSPELDEALNDEREMFNEVERLAGQDTAEFVSSLPLMPYQKVGAQFMARIGSGLLGDEMGLGKTIQSLAVIEGARPVKVLIFCPAILKHQWKSEIERFTALSVVVIEGDAEERIECWNKEATVYVANYELLLRDLEHMIGTEWDYIVADEATKISNPYAKQSKAIKKLKAKNRIALTGTPISNRANEIWNIIDFTNPGVLGSYFQFIEKYCVKNHFGGIFAYKNLEELQYRLKRFMIRRMKKDVLKELPEKIVADISFKMTEEEEALYMRLKKEILFEIDQIDINKIENPMTIQNTMTKMLRLRQLTDSMELLGEKTRSSKLEALRELLAEAMDGERKAIVFTQFATMANILNRELAEYQPLMITGEVDQRDRYRIVDDFNNKNENKVLIMTSAGQFGLNIQRASVIFHYDQEWSLAKMEQRDGRAHRYGQKETVLVYNLLAEGTVDFYVRKVLHKKAKLSASVLGDEPITMVDIRDMLK